MSINQYAPVAEYLGAGNLAAYTFDFKIRALTELLVVVADATGAEVQRVRGDDTSYLSSVAFDADNGGGTVNLLANLPTNYRLLLIQANDAPTQDFEFRNKGSFKLRDIENALDEQADGIQRLAYIASRSIRLHDLDSVDPVDLVYFNPMLPPKVAGQAHKIPTTNANGNGWEDPTLWIAKADIQAAINAAAAAAISEANAAASAAAAALSAAQAAASATAAAASATAAASYAIRANVLALAQGVSSKVVTYSSPMGAPSTPIVSVINTIDANPIAIQCVITAYDASGFTVVFNAPTDTGNYQLAYQTSGVV